jgi:hypothetical protein
METFDLIFLIVFSLIISLGLFIVIFGLIRNNKVAKFRNDIIDLCQDYNRRHSKEIFSGNAESAYDWLYRKLPSYNEMVMSFKPLTLESYIMIEDYEKLMS